MARAIARHEGRDILQSILEDGGARVKFLSYGCVTQDWRVAVGGHERPVVLGFDRFEDYLEHSRSFGIIAGRVANRTSLGRFSMGGESFQLSINHGRHHLHGGTRGLGRRNWTLEEDSSEKAILLEYVSEDGEEGYPGRVRLQAEARLKGTALTWTMRGFPDRPTPLNLAQHNYYNLAGGGDVRGHWLRLSASHYTPVDRELIPTGEILPVGGTRLDFRRGAVLGERDPRGEGIDLNLVLEEGRDVGAPAAVLGFGDELALRLWTDQPGIQVFDASGLCVGAPGLDGIIYGAFAGICLEAQGFPDSLSHAHFPSVIVSPESPYEQSLTVDISPPSGD